MLKRLILMITKDLISINTNFTKLFIMLVYAALRKIIFPIVI